jgi:ABC-type nitrate/sulfonate/bicarbonate transport system permease component
LPPELALTDPPRLDAFAGRIPGQPRRLARYEGLLIGTAAVLAFLAVWQVAAFRRLVPELFLPGPSDIAAAFAEYVARGQIWPDMWISGQELIYGFLLSIVVGLPLGMLMGWYRRLNYALDPFVTFFYSIPRVALTPLFIIWFGTGAESKVAVSFLIALFSIVIDTVLGLRSADPAALDLVRAYGGGRWQQMLRVRLIAALPSTLAALKIAGPAALLGAIIGEYLGAESGLGVAMINSQQSLAVDRTWGIALVATAISGAAYGVTALAGRLLTPWAPRTPR